jgi:hypothetical protein
MFPRRCSALVLLGAATYAWSATVTVCREGCTTASLQAALDTLAGCGDTIQIRSAEPQTGNFKITYRGCGTQPITVTTDRADWLPPEGGRITPSHLKNLAILASPNSFPALQGVLDRSHLPASGWVFVGVAFTAVPGTGAVYALVDLAGLAYSPSGPQELPENITFDRCYFYSPLPNARSANIQNILRANGKNITVKDSFLGDAAWPGIESHGIFLLETPGPVTIRNNYITASSIPIFGGGTTPSYPVVPANLRIEYNYTFRPWKWNSDPAQPFAADYAANGAGYKRAGPYDISAISNTGVVTIASAPPFWEKSVLTISGVAGCAAVNRPGWRVGVLTSRTFQLLQFPGCDSPYAGGGQATDYSYEPCLKNHGEFKFADAVLWRYNVGENSWSQASCQSQQNGFTNTTRTEWDVSDGTRLGRVSLLDPTHLRWTGTYKIGVPGSCCGEYTKDLGVCVSLPNTGTECRPVASFDNNAQTLVTTAPFSAAPGGTQKWWISYTASARLANLTVTNNVWRNVSQGITFLGYSFSNGVGDAGYGKNHAIHDNLWWNSSTYVDSQMFWRGAAGEADYNYSPENYSFTHNTFYSVTPLKGSFVYLDANQCNDCSAHKQTKWNHFTWSNNLMGPSAQRAPFGGDSFAGIADTAAGYLTNSAIQNNAIPGATGTSGCAGTNICSGNDSSEWNDPFVNSSAGVLKLASGGKYSNAGTDHRDLGADFDQLPLINNLSVTASAHSAELEFDVSAPIADVRGTQPCVLEVSPNRNLHSGLDVYEVIADLDPLLFHHADISTRSNPQLAPVQVSGNHVIWPLGREDAAGVTGDDSRTQRQLQLAPATTYYGRLMCHGDTRWFTFQTEPGPATSLSAQMEVTTKGGTTGVRVLYYTQPSEQRKAEFAVAATGTAQLKIPVKPGAETHYQLEFLRGDRVAYKSRASRIVSPSWPATALAVPNRPGN